MKFEEKSNVITIPKFKNCFIYFLIKNEEVVYVGQTKVGLSRPLTHKDKEYDVIKIIYCCEALLDLMEDLYIKKYKPYYNKSINHSCNYSLARVRDKIRKLFNDSKFNISKLKRIIKELNIQTFDYEGSSYIDVSDFTRIITYIGEQENEK